MIDMKKCRELREKHPERLFLFGNGDFYESYNRDAIKVGKICNLSVTVRDGVRVCDFPRHGLDTYLPLLIRAGERIAVCDEMK